MPTVVDFVCGPARDRMVPLARFQSSPSAAALNAVLGALWVVAECGWFLLGLGWDLAVAFLGLLGPGDA